MGTSTRPPLPRTAYGLTEPTPAESGPAGTQVGGGPRAPGPRRPHCLTTSALPRPARRSSTRARHPHARNAHARNAHARNAHARNAHARNAHAPGAKGWRPGVVGVRSSYSSFFATPKSRDRVLHVPQQTVANVTATRKVPPEVPPVERSGPGVASPPAKRRGGLNNVTATCKVPPEVPAAVQSSPGGSPRRVSPKR